MSGRRAPMMLREIFPRRLGVSSPGSRILVVVLTMIVCAGTAGAAFAGDESVASNYTMAVWASEKGMPGDVFTLAQDLEGYLWLGGPTGLLRFDGNHFTPWEPADPASRLPSGPVHAIVGSHDGSIWVGFGGGGGIVRIHRGQMVRYAPSDGAPPGVAAMIQDRQGVIWVASRRGLFRFLNGRWTALGTADGLSGAEAFSLSEDSAGRLWTGAASGVYQRKKDTFELVDATETTFRALSRTPRVRSG